MHVTHDRSLGHLLGSLKAIADEKRLRILALLSAGERCVCELQEELEAQQSLLSFHLKVLKDADLVRDRRQGRWVYYSLNRDALGEVEQILGEIRTSEDRVLRPARCCD